jgi:hypothetical protein
MRAAACSLNWPGLLTVSQLAAYTNTPARTLRKVCGVAPIILGETPLWSREEVDQWIAQLPRGPVPRSATLEASLTRVKARARVSTRLPKTSKTYIIQRDGVPSPPMSSERL